MASGGMTGASKLLNFITEIEIEGLEKFRQLRKELGMTEQAGQKAGQGLNHARLGAENASKKGEDTNETFGKMFGVGMNLMFMGMALQQVFGRLAGSMLKMTGVTDTFGAAAQSVLLPFFMAVSPLLNKIAFFFMDLPKPIKMAMGALVAFLAVLGTFMFFGAQVALLAISLSVSLTALATSLLTLLGIAFGIAIAVASVVYIFERFGKVAGTLAAIVAGVLIVKLLGLIATFYAMGGAITTLMRLPLILATYFSDLLVMAGWLKSGLVFLGKAFVGFAAKLVAAVIPVLTTIAAAFKAFLVALTPLIVIAAGLIAGFVAVNAILNKLGGVIKKVVAVIITVIAVVVAVFASAPILIAAAIGAILAVIWNFKDEIIAAIKGAINFVANLPGNLKNAFGKAGTAINNFAKKAVEFFGNLYSGAKDKLDSVVQFVKDLPGKIINAASKLFSAGKEMGKELLNGMKEGIKSVGDQLVDAFYDFLPGPLAEAVKGVSQFSSGLVSRIQDVISVNDFILTSGGKVLEPHKNDTIIGTKNPEALGQGNGNVTVNINDPVMKEDVDVNRVVDEVEDRVNRDTRGRSGLGT